MKNQLLLKIFGALAGLAVVSAFINRRRLNIGRLESFTLKIGPGVCIEDAAELATSEAYETGVPVLFEFNGVTLRARRGFSAGVLVDCYHKAIGQVRTVWPDWLFDEVVMKAPEPAPETPPASVTPVPAPVAADDEIPHPEARSARESAALCDEDRNA